MKSPRDVIIRPVVSEKSYALLEANRYTFLVRPDANKTEIKEAIQKIWNVRVLSVNTLMRKGKVKPVVASLAGDVQVEEAAEYLYQRGIPAYAYSTELPVEVLGAKYKWARGAGLL